MGYQSASCLCLFYPVGLWRKRLFKRGDLFLGFFGERYVGEYLDAFKKDGWLIFHDLPFDGATGPFNIDHVALSRRGIWIV